jgi:hypothetical protein
MSSRAFRTVIGVECLTFGTLLSPLPNVGLMYQSLAACGVPITLFFLLSAFLTATGVPLVLEALFAEAE